MSEIFDHILSPENGQTSISVQYMINHFSDIFDLLPFSSKEKLLSVILLSTIGLVLKVSICFLSGYNVIIRQGAREWVRRMVFTTNVQVNPHPRSNNNQPGVQVSHVVPVLESVARIPPPPPVMGLAVRISPPPPVMGLAARIPPPPPVMEIRSEECEPEDEDGAASFSQQILQACERMVLRSSKREKGEKPCE